MAQAKRFMVWHEDGTGHWHRRGIVSGAGKGRQVRRLVRMEGPVVAMATRRSYALRSRRWFGPYARVVLKAI